MARPLRIDYPGAWHHVMNRGRRKESIFLCDDDRVSFLELLAVIHERYGVEVNAYALMGNHYHLLLHTPLGKLSPAIKHLDGVHSQRLNRRHGFDGPNFRGRFASKLVESGEYLSNVVRYIHRNPLSIAGLNSLENFRWSSYPEFLALPEVRSPWLSSDAIEASGVRSRAELRAWTQESTKFDPDEYPEVIGSPSFIAAALGRSSVDVETIGNLRRAALRPSMQHIDEAIDVVAEEGVGIATADRRLIQLGLSQELAGLSLQELASWFGYATPQSAGSAAHRFRSRSSDERWALTVEKIRKELEGIVVDGRCRRSESET